MPPQPGDLARDAGKQVLDVVEQRERPLPGQRSGQCSGDLPVGVVSQLERLSQCGKHERRIAQRRERQILEAVLTHVAQAVVFDQLTANPLELSVHCASSFSSIPPPEPPRGTWPGRPARARLRPGSS
jgi:hypothetical protein